MLNWKLILLAVCIIGALGYLAAKEGFKNGGGKQGFQVQKPNPNDNTFTMYYAEWCGHCKTVKPEFEEFVKTGPINVNGKTCQIRMVSPEKEPDKAKGVPIKGFPTFLLETTDGKTVEYKGARNTKGFLEFINNTL
jgi:thiol-disulfide isomerase/thioredoxin